MPVLPVPRAPRRRRGIRALRLACAAGLAAMVASAPAQWAHDADAVNQGAAAAVAGPPPQGIAESLPALLARVLPGDPQVRVAQSLLEAAAERRIAARSRLGPTAGLQAVYGRSQDVDFGSAVDRTIDRSEAYLRWNVLNYGNDAAELNGATRDVAAAAHDLRRAREESAERIAGAYAELLRVESLRPRADEWLESIRRLVRQVQRQNEAGKLSDADAQQAQVSLLDAEIAHEQLLSEIDSARQRLATLVGGEVRPVLPVELPPPTRVEHPLPAVVAAAQERVLAARERVRPPASLLAPRIDFELRQNLGDRTTPRNTTETQRAWQLTARWELPVGGENQARRSEGEKRAEATQAEAERIEVNVRSELHALGPRIAQAKRAVAQMARQVERFDMLVRAGELQFEAGRRTLAQLVQLHESRYNAEQRLAEQASRLLASRLRQLALTGELLQALGQE